MTARVSSASGQLIRSMMTDDEGEGEDVLEDGEHAGGEHLVERVDVGGEAGDEAADGVAVVEGGRHALQVAEDLAAHVEHDLLAGPLHEVGLQQFEQEGEEQRAEIESGDQRDARAWARMEYGAMQDAARSQARCAGGLRRRTCRCRRAIMTRKGPGGVAMAA